MNIDSEERINPRGKMAEQTPILIIDDDPEIRECIIFALREDGFSAEHAADFESGVAAARKYNPKVILLDYLMTHPVKPSEVARLRAAAGNPKVVLMTASREYEDFRRLGVDQLLLKPFDVDKLISAVGMFTSETEGVVGTRYLSPIADRSPI